MDRDREIGRADQELERGNLDRAIELYLELFQRDPADVRCALKLGDALSRADRILEACEAYERAAQLYRGQRTSDPGPPIQNDSGQGDSGQGQAGQGQAGQGDLQKAAAVYQYVLQLDPGRGQAYHALTEVYQAMGLMAEAALTLDRWATRLFGANHPHAMETLEKAIELDPSNFALHIRHGEALSKLNRMDQAARAFSQAALLLQARGHTAGFIKVAERLLYHRPKDLEVARQLAQHYLDMGDGMRALTKLQLAFKVDPRDVETLRLLAVAFESVDQVDKAASVCRELGRVHLGAGRLELAREAMEWGLRMMPEHRVLGRELQELLSKLPPQVESSETHDVEVSNTSLIPEEMEVPDAKGPADPPVELLSSVPPVPSGPPLLGAEDRTMAGVPSAMSPGAARSVTASGVEGSSPGTAGAGGLGSAGGPNSTGGLSSGWADDNGAHRTAVALASPTVGRPPMGHFPEVATGQLVTRLLSESDVFQRYGLTQRVVEHLKQVVELQQDHVEARERLRDAYLALGRTDEAIQMLYQLFELSEPDRTAVAHMYLRQILELHPGHEPARGRIAALEAQVSSHTAEDVDYDDEGLGQPTLAAQPQGPLGAPGSQTPDLQDDSRGDSQGNLQAGTGADRKTPVTDRPSAGLSAGESSSGWHTEPPTATREALGAALNLGFGAATADHPALYPADAQVQVSVDHDSVEELLEEVDVFLSQGLWAEGRALLEQGAGRFASHPLVQQRLREVLQRGPGATQGAPPETSRDSYPILEVDVDVDSGLHVEQLAEELAELVDPLELEFESGGEAIDAETVLAAFKKELAIQVSDTDSETHFNLGLAYKEMGLLQEAVDEFAMASRHPDHESAAHLLAGLCERERGNLPESLEAFERSLHAHGVGLQEQLVLHYEIGCTLLEQHREKEARISLQWVCDIQPGFRDVKQRLASISG